jgi:hypothetical protein
VPAGLRPARRPAHTLPVSSDHAPAAPAAAVLSGALGYPVRLGDETLLRAGARSRVLRYRVTPAATTAPAAGVGPTTTALARDALPDTVVVKALSPDSALGFTDWASLRFLGGVAEAAGLVPEVYGGDAAARVVVLEDLGGQESLEGLLEAGPGPAAARNARAACLAMAGQYARLHRATRGREASFALACAATPLAAPQGRQEEARRWIAGLDRVRAWLDAAGCPVPPDFEPACERVAGAYAEPGPWLTFTHGDPAPTNTHVAPVAAGPERRLARRAPGGGRGGEPPSGRERVPYGDAVRAGPEPLVRLLDFEYGAYRHALYDLTAWDVLCPLPLDLLGAMRRRYRAALAGALPVAGAASFDAAWGAMATFRALAILSWIPTGVLTRDAPWVGDWTARQAILAALGRLRRATAGRPELGPVRRVASSLEARLRARWATAGAPLAGDLRPAWPALRPAPTC